MPIKTKTTVPGNPNQRVLAEKALDELQCGNPDLAGMSREDTAALIHELSIHQIELKMQNHELRRIQDELEKARDRYAHLYDYAPVGYLIVGENGQIQEANMTAASLLGVERHTMAGMWFSMFIAADSQDSFYLNRMKLFETKEPQTCELKLIRKGVGPVDAQLDCLLLKKDTADTYQIRIVITDITDRLNQARKLSDSEERLRILYEAAPDAYFLVDPDSRITDANRAAEEMIGYQRKEIIGKQILKTGLLAEAEIPKLLSLLTSVLKEKGVGVEEFTLIRKDGIRVLVEIKTHGIQITDRPMVLAIARDISKHRKMQQDLRESESRFRNLIEGSIQGILIHRDLKPLFANRSFADIHGRTVAEITELDSILDLIHETDRERVTRYLTSGLRGEKEPRQCRYRGRRQDGELIWIEHRIRMIDWFGEPAIQSTIFDITAEKKAEDTLKIAHERLEHDVEHRTRELNAINLMLRETDQQRKILSNELIRLLEKDRHQMAMELHDHIGQSMTSLKIGLEMSRDHLPNQNSLLKVLLDTQAKRVAELLKDVKRISHGLRPSTLDSLGLVPSLQNLFTSLENQTATPIRFFVKQVPKHLPPEKELAIYRITQEAVNNIQKHAFTETIHVNLIGRDGWIFLSIEDNGRGFDLNEAMEITSGKTPLGLLIMKERVEQLGGEFSIDTTIGAGTTIMVRIPDAPQPPEAGFHEKSNCSDR